MECHRCTLRNSFSVTLREVMDEFQLERVMREIHMNRDQ
jgi:hypothetical protein